jgi:hypothetical protein
MTEDPQDLPEAGLLEGGLLEPPADFTERVMARIEALPVPLSGSKGRLEALQWLALLLGGLLGMAQLATFMFGLWFATAAG